MTFKIDVRDSTLITGGSGYLGRALAKHLLEEDSCRKICIYSRNEAAQARMAADLREADPQGKLRFFIGDVRDRDRLGRAMQDVDTVIHAAALKRVEVGEYNPAEMMKTNVLGTMNVIDAALDNTVTRVLLISSDKACEPLNAYGASKLCAEKLILGANNTTPKDGPMFAVVRYGNVAGSTGSVIPIWHEQIQHGQRQVIVRNPQTRRFFMHVHEAVDLVMWTLRWMRGGETVVPMLPVYSLETLAAAMEVGMIVNSLGSGEKPDEAMIGTYEAQDFLYNAETRYFIRAEWARDDSMWVPMGPHCPARELSVESLREELGKVPLDG